MPDLSIWLLLHGLTVVTLELSRGMLDIKCQRAANAGRNDAKPIIHNIIHLASSHDLQWP